MRAKKTATPPPAEMLDFQEDIQVFDAEPYEEELPEQEAEVEQPGSDLDSIRAELEAEKERIRAERAAQGKTGRPGKSARQKQLEKELEQGTRRIGSFAQATPPGEDEEQMFLGFDTLTPKTIINLFDVALTSLLIMAKHPAPETLPLTPAEKKAIEPPLTAYLNEQAVKLTPGAALALTVGSIVVVKALPVIIAQVAEMQEKKRSRKTK